MKRLLVGALVLLGIPAPLGWSKAATAKKPAPLRSTSPSCPLRCPEGYRVAHYSWELHAERTIYDEKGNQIVPPDGVWTVKCALRCEQHAVNEPTKVHTADAPLCRSGAEPAPYTGPWRITGQFVRECASLQADGCGLRCYEIRLPKPPKKPKRGR